MLFTVEVYLFQNKYVMQAFIHNSFINYIIYKYTLLIREELSGFLPFLPPKMDTTEGKPPIGVYPQLSTGGDADILNLRRYQTVW